MTKKYRSKISAAVHESMSDLHKSGLIDDAKMREFDRSCVVISSRSAGKVGVSLARRTAAALAFRIFKDAAGDWRWQLTGANGRQIASSGEGYKTKKDCVSAIDLVKSAADAEVVS